MDRKDAEKHLTHIKNCKHNDVKAYKHLAKLLEYILYELDKFKEMEAHAPSVYGSWAGEPNYADYDDEAEKGVIELPEVVMPEVEESADYIDAATVPMVLAMNGLMTPFRVDESKPSDPIEVKETTPTPIKDVVEVVATERSPSDGVGFVSVSTKPKRLRIETEKDKGALHTEALKKVKEHLRAAKKKSVKGTKD